jgi:hypothetical protein
MLLAFPGGEQATLRQKSTAIRPAIFRPNDQLPGGQTATQLA